MGNKATRRTFLKLLGAAGATASAAMAGVAGRVGSIEAAEHVAGEQFGDFLILPYDSPLPAWVASTGVHPPLEGASGSIMARLDSPPALRKEIGFPTYTIQEPESEGLRLGTTYLVRSKDGRVASAGTTYEAREASGVWSAAVEVSVSETFLWPVPVWESMIDDKIYEPVRFDGFGTEALVIKTVPGYLVQWLDRGRLYQLRAEYGQTVESVTRLAKKMVKV